MRKSASQFLLLFAFMLLLACEKQNYPIEPEIEFLSISPNLVKQSEQGAVNIVIGFRDGDGDLGSSDTSFNDLFYKIRSRNLTLDTLIPLRLPNITPSGNSKAISGEIDLRFEILFLVRPPFLRDTIAYEIYILDRERHQSNTIITEEIIVER